MTLLAPSLSFSNKDLKLQYVILTASGWNRYWKELFPRGANTSKLSFAGLCFWQSSQVYSRNTKSCISL